MPLTWEGWIHEWDKLKLFVLPGLGTWKQKDAEEDKDSDQRVIWADGFV